MKIGHIIRNKVIVDLRRGIGAFYSIPSHFLDCITADRRAIAFIQSDPVISAHTHIPFHQFRPTFRGRTLTDVPPLDTSRIQQLAFMLADKKPGPFTLEIDFVRTWKSNTL